MEGAGSCPASLCQDDSTLTGITGIDRMLSPSGRLQRTYVLGGPPRSKTWFCLVFANSASAGSASPIQVRVLFLLASDEAIEVWKRVPLQRHRQGGGMKLSQLRLGHREDRAVVRKMGILSNVIRGRGFVWNSPFV